MANTAREAAPPARGPETATSKSSLLLRSMDLNCVTLPKVPSCPLGTRKDGPSFVCKGGKGRGVAR